MSLPVVIYALVLLVFLWQGAGQYGFSPTASTSFGFLVAILFVFSDSLLAFNKFVKALKWALGVLMVLY